MGSSNYLEWAIEAYGVAKSIKSWRNRRMFGKFLLWFGVTMYFVTFIVLNMHSKVSVFDHQEALVIGLVYSLAYLFYALSILVGSNFINGKTEEEKLFSEKWSLLNKKLGDSICLEHTGQKNAVVLAQMEQNLVAVRLVVAELMEFKEDEHRIREELNSNQALFVLFGIAPNYEKLFDGANTKARNRIKEAGE